MLSNIALEALNENLVAKARLATAFEKKNTVTIERWIEKNDPMLTTVIALQIIREETGLTDEQILEPVKAN